MWRKAALVLCLYGVYCSSREFQSDRGKNTDDDVESDYDVHKYNRTVFPTTTGHTIKAEMAVEKFVDTMMASEKYLKMIETVEVKLHHLSTVFLERSDVILKYITEMLTLIKTSPVEMLENSLKSLKNDLDKLKRLVSHQMEDSPKLRGDNQVKSAKTKYERSDSNDNLWKNEYETELSDAIVAPNSRKNYTRAPQATTVSDNEVVLEKLMDSITANEKYLRKIENIDFRLTRLDVELHEKSNAILNRLTEMTTAIPNHDDSKNFTSVLDDLKLTLGQIKLVLKNDQHQHGKNTNADNVDCHFEVNLDNRLSFLETHMKSLMKNVDAIANVISEVQNRQRSRNLNRSDMVSGVIDPTSLVSEFRRVLHEQKSKKCDCKTGRVDRSERYPNDCQEIQAQGFNITGIYKIKPDEMEPFYVLCDLNTAGGGWTVIQNRFDGSQDFFKSWSEYKHGFGNLAGEFWLGLEKIYYLTNQKLYELRVEMEGQDGQEASGIYSVFTLGPEYEGYRISTIGTFRGSAGDSLSYHAGQKFSTHDVDNDEWKEGSCANEHGGAWWYKECDKSNLNGKYLTTSDDNNAQTIYWISFKGPNTPLYKTRMMIRPLPASRPMEYYERLRNTKLSTNKIRGKDIKSAYHEAVRGRIPYRFDDVAHPDSFFPNYA